MSAAASNSELSHTATRLRPYALKAFGISLLSSLLILAPSWYMLEVYERVVNSRNAMTLAMLTLAVLAAYAVMEVLDWARSEMMAVAGEEFDSRLGRRVFSAAFEGQRRRHPGGGVQALQDLRTLREFISSAPLLALMEAPVSLVFLALIFAISPVLGVVALAVAVVQVAIGLMNQRSTQEPLKSANRDAAVSQQQADHMQLQAPVVASMGMEAALQRRWRARQSEAVALQARASLVGGRYQAASKLLQNLVTSALLGLSCWLLLRDQLNGGAGMLVVAGILGGRVIAPCIQIITQWAQVAAARESWLRLSQLLQDVPARQPSMPLPAPCGSLQVDNIVAAAPGLPTPLLRGIAFALRPGEAAVVLGPSGAGKSCLARVVLGLWPTAAGKVRLDGADVSAWNRDQLGPYLGYLPQNVELTEGTLADNIARFGDADPVAVEAAARAVGLHDHIAALPEGYDTWVGPGGSTLSGGQRQRVALARALYRDPVLVVLDEPNASLDESGEAMLASVIAQGRQRGCSFVVMSHRLGVLAAASHVLLLRDGQQQAFGPRDEVLAAIQKATAQAHAQAQARAVAAEGVPA